MTGSQTQTSTSSKRQSRTSRSKTVSAQQQSTTRAPFNFSATTMGIDDFDLHFGITLFERTLGMVNSFTEDIGQTVFGYTDYWHLLYLAYNAQQTETTSVAKWPCLICFVIDHFRPWQRNWIFFKAVMWNTLNWFVCLEPLNIAEGSSATVTDFRCGDVKIHLNEVKDSNITPSQKQTVLVMGLNYCNSNSLVIQNQSHSE